MASFKIFLPKNKNPTQTIVSIKKTKDKLAKGVRSDEKMSRAFLNLEEGNEVAAKVEDARSRQRISGLPIL